MQLEPLRTFLKADSSDMLGARIKPFVEQNLGRLPVDCLPGVKSAIEFLNRCSYLCRPMDDKSDLRVISLVNGSPHVALFGERLDWDSEFFGYGVCKVHEVVFAAAHTTSALAVLDSSINKYLTMILERDIRYVFTAIDADNTILFRSLTAAGFELIETRLVYWRELSTYIPRKRFRVRAATASDFDSLARVARETVNPFDRFRGDRHFTNDQIDNLFNKWIAASLEGTNADLTLVPAVGATDAFLTLRFDSLGADKSIHAAQAVLCAVASTLSGWLVKLLSESMVTSRISGSEYMYFTTQLANRSVIRACQALGFTLGKGQYVLRKCI